MRENKFLLSFILFLLILVCSIPSLATEEFGTIDLSPSNYYKVREEVYKAKDPSKDNIKFKVNSSLSILDYLVQEAYKFNSDINITEYKIPVSEIQRIVINLVDIPELYFINPEEFRYYWVQDSETGQKLVTRLLMEYYMTQDEINAANAIIDSVAADYLSGIKPEWNDLEKVIYTNNYLCRNCSYADNIIMSSHTIYGALVAKEPVCDGYSKAFKFLINKVGVESVVATSLSMQHAWNMVNVNGDFYHLDVTWNDDDKGVGTISYVYFMCSDTGFSSSQRNHYGWVAENNQLALNTQFDNVATWQLSKGYLLYKDNYWYYLRNNTGVSQIVLEKYDARNYGTYSIPNTISLSKRVNVGPGLATDGDYLFFTTDYELNRMTFNGTNRTNIYTLPGTNKVVYSIDYINGNIYYDTLDVASNGTASTATRKTNLFGPYKSLKGISLNKTSLELEKGQKETLVVTLNPTDATDNPIITWAISDQKIAKVNDSGEVTAVSPGKATLIVKDTVSGLSATCSIEVIPELVFTTLTEDLVEDTLVFKFEDKTVISSILTAENFPCVDRGYTVKVQDQNGADKTDSQYIGSYNKVIIKDKNGEVVREYTVVTNGDITGDGRVKIYDAFQILKGTLYSNKLTMIDKLVRDYNLDGKVAIYDAFRFIRKAILA